MRNQIRGEYLKPQRFKALPVLPWLAILTAVLWMFLRADTVTGDQLKRLIDDSLSSAITGVWYLYREDEDQYCFRTPRPPWPDKRYCVPKTDLEVVKRSGRPVIGYVALNELVLKAERRPGAQRVQF
ncbi:hypothetical protein [Lysobacter sp. CA199]|uniref:hypothetical protein n=1 Tax=Lysobacter sp. CA199 TaxID=3455608 RepID=UPI003F8D8EAB